MRTLNVSGQENPILPLICLCLLAVLAWNLFLVWTTTVFTLLTIQEAANSGKSSKVSTLNRLNANSTSWRGGNQFLAKLSIEYECNHADFVPLLRAAKSNDSLAKCLLEKVPYGDQKFVLTSLLISIEPLKNNRDDHSSLKMLKANSENDMDQSHTNQIHSNVNQNANVDFPYAEETNNVEPSATNERETITKEEITIKETTSTMRFMDQPDQKCFGEAMMECVSVDPSEEKRAEDTLNPEDKDATWVRNEASSPREIEEHLEIETNGRNSGGSLTNLTTKERQGTSATSFPREKFSSSILRIVDTVLKTDTNELPGGTTIASRMENLREKHVLAARKENCSRMVDELEEFLSCSSKDEDNGACSPKKDDCLERRFELIEEKRIDCIEEKSVMRSGKNATQSRNAEDKRDENEEQEEVGPPPETSSSKNRPETASTNSLHHLETSSNHGKEQDDLNAIIRRMIIMELRRHRKKQTMLKRAHSDTESVLPRKKYNNGNRAGLFGVEGQMFFRDLSEQEEGLRKGVDDTSDGKSAELVIVESTTKQKESAKNEADRSRNDIDVSGTIGRWLWNSISSITIVCTTNSNIRLERKANASCLRNTLAEEPIEGKRPPMVPEHSQASKSTQTEHMYVIRAARSCPLRKRRVPVQFQMHRLALTSDAVHSKTVFASLDLSRFVVRKASDNLIYEKGKASRSPSFIPTPKRHRWKYLLPTKTK